MKKKTFVEHAEEIIQKRKNLLKTLAKEDQHPDFDKKKSSR